MPRSGRLRTFIKEYKESPRFEKLSFIPPFLIIFVEGVLLVHAFTIDVPDIMVVELTMILLIISIVEIIFVFGEMHEHFKRNNFDRILTIKLDDFIIERREKNVKKIVTNFIKQYPKYGSHRSEIYHTTCQILETHKEEVWEGELTDKLEKFVKRRKKMNVNDLLEAFLKKFPTYKKYRSKTYEKICQIKGDFKRQ
jgi:hypothetical protein